MNTKKDGYHASTKEIIVLRTTMKQASGLNMKEDNSTMKSADH